MNINRVATNIWSINAPHTASAISHVPHFYVLVPTSWHNQVWVVLDELGAENSIVMAQITLCTRLELPLELPSLLIVDSNLPVLACSQEFFAIYFVICSEQLVFDVKNFVQLLSWRGMEVRQGSICVCSNQDVLSHSWSTDWSPSEVSGGHLVLHFRVEHVALLLSDYIENTNWAISARSCDVFVIVVKSDAVGRCCGVTKGKLVLDFEFATLRWLFPKIIQVENGVWWLTGMKLRGARSCPLLPRTYSSLREIFKYNL